MLLFVPTVTAASFELSIEPELGIQNGVPAGRNDSVFNTYFYGAAQVEPVWSKRNGSRDFRSTTSLHTVKYIGGPGELDIEEHLSLEREFATHSTGGTIGAAYHFLPTAYDPTSPEKYMDYSFGCNRKRSGSTGLQGTYSLNILDDVTSTRYDVRNSLYLSIGKDFTRHLHLFLKIGGAWNLSNTEGAGYIQPSGFLGTTILPDEKNMLLLQISGSCAFYQPVHVPVLTTAGRGRRQRVDTLAFTLTATKIPLTMLYCDFGRELTARATLHFYYLCVLFGRGRTYTPAVSHQCGISLEWVKN